MIRRLCAALAAMATGAVLVGCAPDEVQAGDAYAIGCPAIDATLGGSNLATRAAATGLERLRDSGQLNPEATTWTDAAVRLLQTADAEDLPPEARRLVVDGCAANGHPLKNLRA